MKKAVIVANNLGKIYSDFSINNINLEIPQGELFGFLGPNGAGKTTVVKLLSGQTCPSSGVLSVMGVDVTKDPLKLKEMIGIVPEQENPPSFLTAFEYLSFVSKIRKIKNAEPKILKWLKFLNCQNQKDVLCKDLSRGTKQKLIVAQAFIHEPKLVFIDEPLINLDPVIQSELKSYFKKYIKKGNTIFLSTHVLEIADEICTSIGIIKNGKLYASDKISKVKRKKETLLKAFQRITKK